MNDLASYIIKALVENPDDVQVEQQEPNEGMVQILIKVHPDDMGRIIGKQGRTINSIRSILKIAARKKDLHVKVDLQEPDDLKTSPKAESDSSSSDEEQS